MVELVVETETDGGRIKILDGTEVLIVGEGTHQWTLSSTFSLSDVPTELTVKGTTVSANVNDVSILYRYYAPENSTPWTEAVERLTVARVDLEAIETVADSLLENGLICLNAQDEYKNARWKAIIKPAGLYGEVTSSAEVSILNIEQEPLVVADGDPFDIKGNNTGPYELTIQLQEEPSIEGQRESFVFKFEFKLVQNQDRSTEGGTPDSVYFNYGSYEISTYAMGGANHYTYEEGYESAFKGSSAKGQMVIAHDVIVVTFPENAYDGDVKARFKATVKAEFKGTIRVTKDRKNKGEEITISFDITDWLSISKTFGLNGGVKSEAGAFGTSGMQFGEALPANFETRTPLLKEEFLADDIEFTPFGPDIEVDEHVNIKSYSQQSVNHVYVANEPSYQLDVIFGIAAEVKDLSSYHPAFFWVNRIGKEGQ